MVIYLDLLLCLNLFVNFFLLKATAALSKTECGFWRMLLGALLGAATSLTILLPSLPLIIDLWIRVLAAAGMVLIAFSYNSKRTFIRHFGTLFLCSFGFAGVMFAVWFLFRPNGMQLSGNAVYFDISPLLLIVSTVVAYGILRLISFFSQRRAEVSKIYTISITLNDRTVCTQALCDTGNHLTDLLSGNPVVVVEHDLVKSLLPTGAECFTTVGAQPPPQIQSRYRVIPFTAVGGKGFLPAFVPDMMEIARNDKKYKTSKVTVAVSKDLMTDEYRALIGSELATFLEEG